MKVYIVIYHVPYECDDIMGVYFDKKAAKVCRKFLSDQRDRTSRDCTYTVEEWPVE